MFIQTDHSKTKPFEIGLSKRSDFTNVFGIQKFDIQAPTVFDYLALFPLFEPLCNIFIGYLGLNPSLPSADEKI